MACTYTRAVKSVMMVTHTDLQMCIKEAAKGLGISQLKPEQKEAISRGSPCTRIQCFTRAPTHGIGSILRRIRLANYCMPAGCTSATLLTMQTLSFFLVGGAGVQDQQEMGPKS